jgi:hypothetical protein
MEGVDEMEEIFEEGIGCREEAVWYGGLVWGANIVDVCVEIIY